MSETAKYTSIADVIAGEYSSTGGAEFNRLSDAIAMALLAAEQDGIREGMRRAAEIAREHLSHVLNHHPDIEGDDLVAHGYGNAALNIRTEILSEMGGQ